MMRELLPAGEWPWRDSGFPRDRPVAGSRKRATTAFSTRMVGSCHSWLMRSCVCPAPGPRSSASGPAWCSTVRACWRKPVDYQGRIPAAAFWAPGPTATSPPPPAPPGLQLLHALALHDSGCHSVPSLWGSHRTYFTTAAPKFPATTGGPLASLSEEKGSLPEYGERVSNGRLGKRPAEGAIGELMCLEARPGFATGCGSGR